MKMELRDSVFFPVHRGEPGRRRVAKLDVTAVVANESMFERDVVPHAAAINDAITSQPIGTKRPLAAGAFVSEAGQTETAPQQQPANDQMPDMKHAPPEPGVHGRFPGG